MSKQKKRKKVYTGEDAKITQPTVHRFSAVDRGRFGQWWFERKTMIKRIILWGGGTILGIYLLIEAIRAIF